MVSGLVNDDPKVGSQTQVAKPCFNMERSPSSRGFGFALGATLSGKLKGSLSVVHHCYHTNSWHRLTGKSTLSIGSMPFLKFKGPQASNSNALQIGQV